MKLKNKPFTWVFLLVALSAIAMALITTGCKTTGTAPASAQRIEYDSTATIVTAVDAAMKTWGAFVVSQRTKLAGDLSGLQFLAVREEEVSKAYREYQLMARTLVLTEISNPGYPLTNSVSGRISGPMIQAATPLLALIKQFTTFR